MHSNLWCGLSTTSSFCVIASLMYLDTVWAHMGVMHLLLPAQLPGTHWAMICVIWHLALTVSDVCLKLGCFRNTSIYITLEVSHFVLCVNSRRTYLDAFTFTCLLNIIGDVCWWGVCVWISLQIAKKWKCTKEMWNLWMEKAWKFGSC